MRTFPQEYFLVQKDVQEQMDVIRRQKRLLSQGNCDSILPRADNTSTEEEDEESARESVVEVFV